MESGGVVETDRTAGRQSVGRVEPFWRPATLCVGE